MEESTGTPFSRRSALAKIAGIGGLTAACQLGAIPGADNASADAATPHEADADIPIRGKAAKGLEEFDDAVLAIMNHHGVIGASLAIALNGKLIVAKGYGWMDAGGNEPLEPDAIFGLASISKVFTTAGVFLLIEQGKFGLDDSIFKLLNHIKPPKGAKTDPRLGEITVRHCMNHSAGWDRHVTGDSTGWEPSICRVFHTKPPATTEQFISFAMAVPLMFKPGSRNEYSNIGFVLLGELINKYGGMPYEKFIQEKVLKPVGIKNMGLHRYDNKYLPNEARRHLPGATYSLPPVMLPMIDYSGGWSGSSIDLVRYMSNIEGSRGKPILSEKSRNAMFELPQEPIKPRQDGSYFGLGWDSAITTEKGFGCSKEGNLPGIRTLLKRKLNGVCWSLLMNTTMEYDQHDAQVVAKATADVLKRIDGIENVPDVDFFDDFK
jgi:CubicO group peptidase (beta-lactamase class C family)